MILDGLRVPPFNTTLHGATSDAFLINIHETLCPSGPYCWRADRFEVLLRTLGISRTDHRFFGSRTSADERRAIERTLTGWLDRGVPCALLNLEIQLIMGYDDTAWLTAQPLDRG